MVLAIKAHDQRRELVMGDIVSHYAGAEWDEEEVEVTIWHNRKRAAVCHCHGDSEWGDWNEAEQTILLDEGTSGQRRRLDRYGRQLCP
jgi:hypothetical protein